MSANRISLDVRGSRITGIEATGRRGMPLLVCLPGGYDAGYFDVPGYSLVDAAQREGFPVVALDRPGYGGSTALRGEISFRRNAQVLQEAIALWHRHAGAPGGVLIGRSIGGAIVLRLAAANRTWPLLGTSLTGIHTICSRRATRGTHSRRPR